METERRMDTPIDSATGIDKNRERERDTCRDRETGDNQTQTDRQKCHSETGSQPCGQTDRRTDPRAIWLDSCCSLYVSFCCSLYVRVGVSGHDCVSEHVCECFSVVEWEGTGTGTTLSQCVSAGVFARADGDAC